MRRPTPVLIGVIGLLLALPSVSTANILTPPRLIGQPAAVRPEDGTSPKAFGLGWYAADFGSGSSSRFYTVFARLAGSGTGSPLYQTTVGANFTDARLIVPDGTYNVYVQAQASYPSGVKFATSPTAQITFDATAPSAPTTTINNGATWTNRLSIDVIVRGGSQSVHSAQVDTGSSTFACDARTQTAPACPIPAALQATSYVARGTFELPSGDGLKLVYSRVRDPAQVGLLYTTPTFGQRALTGNPSPSALSLISLDTTAPTVRLASTTPTGVAGTDVALDASGSSDAGSGIRQFEWQFGDGSADQVTTTGKTTHRYPGPGTYDGRVTVYDKAGNALSATDTNLSSATFKTTVAPAPLSEQPGNPTPVLPPAAPPNPNPPATTDPPAAVNTPAPLDQGPVPDKADLPVVPERGTADLPFSTAAATPQGRTATSKLGPLSTARIVGTVQPQKPIPVRLRLRKKAQVKLAVVNEAGKTVAKSSKTLKSGSSTLKVKAPKVPGDYAVRATSGKSTMLLAVTVQAPT